MERDEGRGLKHAAGLGPSGFGGKAEFTLVQRDEDGLGLIHTVGLGPDFTISFPPLGVGCLSSVAAAAGRSIGVG